jgi:hypothetical protein
MELMGKTPQLLVKLLTEAVEAVIVTVLQDTLEDQEAVAEETEAQVEQVLPVKDMRVAQTLAVEAELMEQVQVV